MRQHWITKIIVGILLSLLLGSAASAQSVSLPNLTGSESSEQAEVSNE